MATLDIDFTDVADQFIALEPGIYDAEITEEPELQRNKKDTGNNLVVNLQITGDGPMSGRKIRSYLPTNNPISIKRLLKSCGLTPGSGEFDLAELTGKICKVQVVSRGYTDKDTGEEKEGAQVKDFLFSKDDDDE